MTLAAGTRFGTYEITGQVGVGGMGEVYRATGTNLDREVAIKTLPAVRAADPDRLARFQREARLLAALNHAHIASIHSLGEHEGTLYLAMELVQGETLEEKLKCGALPVEEALELALQIAEALEAAHEKGVIHRDLKPANVMVTPDGAVKVLDFGLATTLSGDPSEAIPAHSPTLSMAMTQQGQVLGTTAYMSPEQASGQATDQRTDIWAFGAVLYEMLTGRPPFAGESVAYVLADVLKSQPDWNRLPKDLPPRLRVLLERCLEKKLRNRLHSIADARAEIEAVLRDPRRIAANAAEAVCSPRSRRPRLATGAFIAGLLLLAGLATGLSVWYLEPSAPEAQADVQIPVNPVKLGVLPFANLSPDPEQRSFSDGLTHELILGLQKLPGLMVYGPATSFALRDSNFSVPEIAAVHGVQYVIEGSVDRDGDRLRIRAQLSDASGVTVWGDSYNGVLGDIFEFQDAIVTGIARQLRATLGLERALGRTSTQSAEAYQLYVVASQGLYTGGWPFARVLELLERALEIDPEFAEALGLKSHMHALLSASLADGREELAAAEESAWRAIAMAPDLGDGYRALGHVHGTRGNWLAAEQSFQRALALGLPLGEMPIYGALLVAEGRFDRAREIYEKVLETDPSQPSALAGLMQVHELRRDREAADAVYRRGRTLYGDEWVGSGNATVLWIGLGRRDAALIDEALRLLTGPFAARFADVIDDPARGIALVNDMATDSEYALPTGLANLAIWAAYFGDTRMSLRLLEKSLAGGAMLMHIYWMPVFDEVRKLPEFRDLLRSVGLVDFWRSAGWPDFCHPIGASDFVCT